MIRLREAVERGDFYAVQIEIAQGVDVDACGPTRWTPLHRASDRGWIDIVRLLLQAGASIDVATTSGGEIPLHIAASKGHANIVREFLKMGIFPNYKAKNGWTALHFAMFKGNESVARTLLRAGADPDLTNSAGLTADQVTRNATTRFVRAAVVDSRMVPRSSSRPSSPPLAHVSSAASEYGGFAPPPSPFVGGGATRTTSPHDPVNEMDELLAVRTTSNAAIREERMERQMERQMTEDSSHRTDELDRKFRTIEKRKALYRSLEISLPGTSSRSHSKPAVDYSDSLVPPPIPQAQDAIDTLFGEIDLNDDGYITREELVNAAINSPTVNSPAAERDVVSTDEARLLQTQVDELEELRDSLVLEHDKEGMGEDEREEFKEEISAIDVDLAELNEKLHEAGY